MLIKIHTVLKQILKTFFPRKCFGCKTPDFWICNKCLGNIPKHAHIPISWIGSTFDYQSKIIRKAIWAIKFGGKFAILGDLSPRLKNSFTEFLKEKTIGSYEFVVIPIPITKRSYQSRHYNQSVLISEYLVPKERILKNILIKTINHLPQNKIKNKKERLENVKNSFKVTNERKIVGRKIILVDDVTTTGATLTEARKVLLSAGAKEIFGFTVAH